MRNLAITVLLVMLSGCASSRGYQRMCGAVGSILDGPHEMASEVILLKPRSTKPQFYIRTGNSFVEGQSHYVVMADPDLVIVQLERMSVGQPSSLPCDECKILLNLVKRDLPLTDNVDLYKYSLVDPEITESIARAAAGLVERGDVTVVDLWQRLPDSVTLSSINIARIKRFGSEYRDFCTISGDSILFMVSGIYD